MGGDVSDSSRRPIPDDWQPQPGTLDICVQQGMTPEFARQQAPPFVLHHREAGTQRPGFESLFVGWCRKAWANRPPELAPGRRRPGQTIAERITEEAIQFEAEEAAAGREDPFRFTQPKQEASPHVH